MSARPQDDDARAKPRNVRWLVWLLIPVGFLVFAGANAHLIYVAFQSEPDCVMHHKVPGEAGRYTAAKSAC